MAVTQPTRLECGRDVDDVWSGLTRPPSAHEGTCPYCREARAQLAPLADATRDVAADDRENPTLSIPAQVFDDLMRFVRTEVRRGRTLPLERPSGGSGEPEDAELTVSELAVAGVVRESSDEIPGVEARRCRVTAVPVRPDSSTSQPRPAAVALDVTVSVAAGAAILPLVQTWREHVAAAVTRVVGVDVASVDVTVEDIHDV